MIRDDNGPPADPPPPNEFNLQGSGREQVDALQLFAYSRNIPGASKPRLKLPGDNIAIGGFAKAFWTLVRERGVFRRDVHVVLINDEEKRLDFMEPHMLQVFADDVVECFKVRVQKNGEEFEFKEVVRSMPVDVTRSLLAAVKVSPRLICEVEKVNYAPMPQIRANGVAELLQPGYDLESKTFTFDCDFKLDEEMSLADATDFLRRELKEFPFGDGVDNPERSLSVQVSCMMTLFAGGLLPRGSSRPMFIFNANALRSGKSLLAKMALITVFGTASSTSWSESKEEFRKSLETAANTAMPYIFFDNVRMHMANADLERFVTSADVTCRVMGKNTENITVPNVATVLITANQATTSTDIAERSLFVNLFVNEADPQARCIKRPIDEVLLSNPEHRRKMLSALWTLVKHWVKEGKPRNESKLVGFEEWSAVIGGIVRTAGFVDPLERPNIAGVGDTMGQRMKELVAWLNVIPGGEEGGTSNPLEFEHFTILPNGRAFTFVQLTKACAEKGMFDEFVPDDGEMKASERSKFGKFLKRYIGRGRVFTIAAGGKIQRLELRENGETGRAKRFQVLDVVEAIVEN